MATSVRDIFSCKPMRIKQFFWFLLEQCDCRYWAIARKYCCWYLIGLFMEQTVIINTVSWFYYHLLVECENCNILVSVEMSLARKRFWKKNLFLIIKYITVIFPSNLTDNNYSVSYFFLLKLFLLNFFLLLRQIYSWTHWKQIIEELYSAVCLELTDFNYKALPLATCLQV